VTQGFDARLGAFLEKDRRAPVAQDRIVTAWGILLQSAAAQTRVLDRSADVIESRNAIREGKKHAYQRRYQIRADRFA
jgi:hypothetical protein